MNAAKSVPTLTYKLSRCWDITTYDA